MDRTNTSKLRKFTHTTIDVVVRYGLGGLVLYGLLGGIYFAITKGITDFGVYL